MHHATSSDPGEWNRRISALVSSPPTPASIADLARITTTSTLLLSIESITHMTVSVCLSVAALGSLTTDAQAVLTNLMHPSANQKHARKVLSVLCGGVSRDVDGERGWAVDESLFQTGALAALSFLCLDSDKPVLESFESSNLVRRLVLDALFRGASFEQIHSQLTADLDKWLSNPARVSTTLADCELAMKIAHRLIGSSTVSLNSVTRLCVSIHAHFEKTSPASSTSSSALCLLFQALMCSQRFSFDSDPAIPLSVFVSTVEHTIRSTSMSLVPNAFEFMPNHLDPFDALKRIVQLSFESPKVLNTDLATLQIKLIESLLVALECSSAYDTPSVTGTELVDSDTHMFSNLLLDVLRFVSSTDDFHPTVQSALLASMVPVARVSKVCWKHVVSTCQALARKNAEFAKVLVRLLRETPVHDLLDTETGYHQQLIQALCQLLVVRGENACPVDVKLWVLKVLMAIQVSTKGSRDPSSVQLVFCFSEDVAEWAGLKNNSRITSSKLLAKRFANSLGSTGVAPEDESILSPTSPASRRQLGHGLINLNLYFETLLRILKTETEWTLYSYALSHLEQQLMHMVPTMAVTAKGVSYQSSVVSSSTIESLRSHFCEFVEKEMAAASVLNLPTSLKKSDLYLLAFKTLAAIISCWHHTFNRIQIETVLRCFQLGLQKWPSTARTCLQILTFLLTELPGTHMTRLTPDMLMQVSRITTSNAMAPSILEYLSTLARLPRIHVNLTEADYKRVYGIALQYIGANEAGGGAGALGGFVVQMAYHVLHVWFVNMRVEDRRKYVGFILGNVLAEKSGGAGGGGGGGVAARFSVDAIDESVELVMDMLVQNTFVDCSARPDTFDERIGASGGLVGDGMASGLPFAGIGAPSQNEKCVEQSWVQGNSVLTIRSLNMSGWAEVTIRRPSGAMVFSMKLENRARFVDAEDGVGSIGIPGVIERQLDELRGSSLELPGASNDQNVPGSLNNPNEGKVSDCFGGLGSQFPFVAESQSLHPTLALSPKSPLQPESTSLLLPPSFILLQLSPYPYFTVPTNSCIPLPSTEEAFIRALKVLDRTPVADLHKIGVVYIGPGQTMEREILSNSSGSQSYTQFLCALGEMVRLLGLKRVHTGGLDTSEAAIDGKACVVWEDTASGSQMVFHTTTLMPTVVTDPVCTLKKRHIGNDFVSVLFDESGTVPGTIGFDTFPGQFNYINFIVTPVAGFEKDYATRRFHVVMRVKAELNLPAVGLFSESGFVVAGNVLAGVVRRAALHANMLAVVVAQTRAGGGGFTSNATERLRQIKRLAERARKAAGVSGDEIDATAVLDFTRHV
ncbi:Tuberous sclerosis 2-like protein [Chytriomyces hyalinus]|nr:Tuberous sclerosis 2-like protein [Chytriomyces hyalinus]